MRIATTSVVTLLCLVLTGKEPANQVGLEAAVPTDQAEAQPGARLPGTVGDRDSRSKDVDELFAEWHSPDSPGAAVLVIHGGEAVHARGYGMANLEHGVPIRTNTVFDIASVSKQFGALAIALLEARGQLDLDDDVRTYVPELPDFGHVITISHMIHHTSGLRDWPSTLRMAGWDFQDVMSFDQILRMVFHQRDLNFVPGEEFAYSNTGYNLLAEVVQRVTGQSYRRWTEENIFRPLGMTSTHFHDDHTEVVLHRAESYRTGANGVPHRVVSSLTALSSSSLFTTVEDLARWIRNFDEPIVGSRDVIARMHELGSLNSGDTLGYAFGMGIDEYRGLRRVSHGGSWAGYRTTLQRFPDEGLAVVVLANTSGMDAGRMGEQVAEIYLRDLLRPPEAAPDLQATAAADRREPEWSPSPVALAEYEGVYESAELWTSWVLGVRDGRLTASHFRIGDLALTPREPDRFDAPGFGDVRFVRGQNGRVEAFTANSVRVRGLRFDRVSYDRAARGGPPPPEQITFPTRDGGVVHADVYGAGLHGVVLVHGGRFNKESWAEQARELEGSGYRVLAIDLRGYGESTGPGQEDIFSAPLHLDVLAAADYLRQAGSTTVSAIGGSLGGGAAASAVIAEPGRIDRLVLLGSTPDGPPEQLETRKLYITTRDDESGAGPRLPGLLAHFENAPEPKELIILEGSAHAQFMFETDQAERIMREILRFLSVP